ncbi:MAG: hypothetical protein HUU01_09000 [Saprospiraceae bacterium]|nr:hypothetical protein [Saprospiraceae bacterium]
MKSLPILFLCFTTSFALYGQKKATGLWEGTLTNGLNSQTGLRFELLLEFKGKKVRGKTYIYHKDNTLHTMEVEGTVYEDRSIYFEEVRSANGQDQAPPPFNRKYQLIFTRSIWESTLDGYWQEIITNPFDEKREMGRIAMKKVSNSKA